MSWLGFRRKESTPASPAPAPVPPAPAANFKFVDSLLNKEGLELLVKSSMADEEQLLSIHQDVWTELSEVEHLKPTMPTVDSSEDGGIVLAQKSIFIGLLLQSCKELNEDIFKELTTAPTQTLSPESQALKLVINWAVELEDIKTFSHDYEVVLTTYLRNDDVLKQMFEVALAHVSDSLKLWALKMSVERSHYSLASVLLGCQVKLIQDARGVISIRAAVLGDVKMLELLYPHIAQCGCADKPAFCVLEEAAKANQPEVVAWLLQHCRQHYTVAEIRSLRGQPGYVKAKVSTYAIYAAPMVSQARSYLPGWLGGAPQPSLLPSLPSASPQDEAASEEESDEMSLDEKVRSAAGGQREKSDEELAEEESGPNAQASPEAEEEAEASLEEEEEEAKEPPAKKQKGDSGASRATAPPPPRQPHSDDLLRRKAPKPRTTSLRKDTFH